MSEKELVKGQEYLFRDFNDEGWSVRTFIGMSEKTLKGLKYMTYNSDTDDVETFLQVQPPFMGT